MKITYSSSEAFYDGVEQCVKRGLQFTADHDALTIKFTGGF